jgi:cytochrome b561
MQLDQQSKLSRTTISLHWLVGLFIIGLLGSGVYMVETRAYGIYDWHKSFGVLILVLVIPRVLWRLHNGWPQPAASHKRYEHILARSVHWTLIIGMCLMPLSGFLMSAIGGSGVSFFGINLIVENNPSGEPGQFVPHNQFLADLFHFVHTTSSKIMIIAVTLHVVGALKHHIVDRDGTLRRMLGEEIRCD